MSRWDQLLLVQQHDTTTDQLQHRLRNLPERAALGQLSSRVAAVEADLEQRRTRRGELSRSQKRLEDEIATLGEKIAHDDKALYAGNVTAPRDLQALQEEIASLQRRVRSLEDDELEIMELAEPVDAEIAKLESDRESLDGESQRLLAAIAEAEAAIASEIAVEQDARAAAVSDVSPEMLAEYESLRPRLGGIAVAKLVGNSCGGCHLTLSAVEVDRIKKLGPDEPAHCEECGRLLVRSS
jgi:predicted  nucleic acid-binding Zn-ribbon protein